jgi:hypothetical protein
VTRYGAADVGQDIVGGAHHVTMDRTTSAWVAHRPVGADNLCHPGRCTAERDPASSAGRAVLVRPDVR